MNKITTYGGVLIKEHDVLFDFSNTGIAFETLEDITITIDCLESDFLAGDEFLQELRYLLLYITVDKQPKRVKITSKNSLEQRTFTFKAHQQVTITKVSEAYMGVLLIKNLLQLPIQAIPKEERVQVEFIGDSLTSGYGNDGVGNSILETDWTKTWCNLLCQKFNWEAMVHSYSCMGLVQNSSGKKEHQIDERRRRILGCDASTVFDFSSFKASYVIVNIGTNDFCGTVKEPLRTQFMTKMKHLIEELFANYGEHIKIILVHGPLMTDECRKVIIDVPELFNDQPERKKKLYLVATHLFMCPPFSGKCSHPTGFGHKMMGEEMIPLFEKIINE